MRLPESLRFGIDRVHVSQFVVASELARASLPSPRLATVALKKVDDVLFVGVLEYLQFLLRVGKFVDHETLDVGETFDHFFLHLSSLELADDFVDVRVLATQVLLLERVVLGLSGLMPLFLD